MQGPIYTALLLLATRGALGSYYCYFYEGTECTGTESVGFSVTNSGCFRAAGASVKCSGALVGNFKLVQSPNDSDDCDCQNACTNSPGSNGCTNLADVGLSPDYDTYRFVYGDSGTCGANNC